MTTIKGLAHTNTVQIDPDKRKHLEALVVVMEGVEIQDNESYTSFKSSNGDLERTVGMHQLDQLLEGTGVKPGEFLEFFDLESDDGDLYLWAWHLAMCMKEGEVLVYRESGYEKSRYCYGSSEAYNHLGESVAIV